MAHSLTVEQLSVRERAHEANELCRKVGSPMRFKAEGDEIVRDLEHERELEYWGRFWTWNSERQQDELNRLSEQRGFDFRWKVKRGKFSLAPAVAPVRAPQARAREHRDTSSRRRSHAKTSSGGKDPPGESDDPEIDQPGAAGLVGVGRVA
jgi:hypothetical protein